MCRAPRESSASMWWCRTRSRSAATTPRSSSSARNRAADRGERRGVVEGDGSFARADSELAPERFEIGRARALAELAVQLAEHRHSGGAIGLGDHARERPLRLDVAAGVEHAAERIGERALALGALADA